MVRFKRLLAVFLIISLLVAVLPSPASASISAAAVVGVSAAAVVGACLAAFGISANSNPSFFKDVANALTEYSPAISYTNAASKLFSHYFGILLRIFLFICVMPFSMQPNSFATGVHPSLPTLPRSEPRASTTMLPFHMPSRSSSGRSTQWRSPVSLTVKQLNQGSNLSSERRQRRSTYHAVLWQYCFRKFPAWGIDFK